VLSVPRPVSPVVTPAPVSGWFAIAIAAPTTSGGRVLQPVNPVLVAKRTIESVPDKDLGKIVFNPPKHMIVGKGEFLEAVIILTDVASVVAHLKGKGKPQVENIRVASKKAGTLVLTLRATRVMEIIGDGQVPRDLPSLDEQIIVTSDYWYSSKGWLSDNKNP
jgi:hypothetical protein